MKWLAPSGDEVDLHICGPDEVAGGTSPLPMSASKAASPVGLCDDGEEPYALCEATLFHGRGDEWFVLEWWGDAIGFVVYEAAPTLYSCDSGPQQPPGLVAAAPNLLAALRAIDTFEQPLFDHPPDEWTKHTPETCADCKRWADMRPPIQNRCDGYYRLVMSRDRRRDEDARALHYKLRNIARAAIKAAGARS